MGQTGVCSGPSSGGGSHTNAGAIAGGVVGGIAGIALFAALFLFIVRRRNQAPKRFNRGRGITPSMIFTDDVDENGFSGTDNSGGGVRRTNSTTRFYNYGFADKHMSFGSGMPPLAANTRAAFDAYYGIGAASRNAAANYANEQVNMETTAVPREVDPTRQSTSSARLSKYNYLTKAFSQLRTSYAPSQAGRDSMTLSESDFQQQMTYNSRKLHQNVTNMNLNNGGQSGEGHSTASMGDNARSETTRDSNPLSHHDSLLLGLEDFVLQPLDAAKQADRYKMRSIYSTYSDTLPRSFNDDASSPPPFAPPSYTAKETQVATPILKQFASSNLDVKRDGNARVSEISRGSGFLTLHAPLFKSHEADISPEPSPTFPKRYSPTTVPPIRSPSVKSNDGPTSPQALTASDAQNQSNQPLSPEVKPEEDEAVPRPTGNGAQRGISLGDEEIIDPIKPMRPSDDGIPKVTAPPGHALPAAPGSDTQSDMTSLDRSSSHLAPSPIGVVRDSIISDVSVESDYNPFRKMQPSGRNYGYF
ncbi:hypothetical protein BZG36_04524 [Bifiguratus adelaidae]|uniref:Uncharacterized protein n=1 Tax=Bifiguratus adelaidae TaxID=1938954 RepID=A0A261XY22_9FUNG|nr:hypothetical protein BZG36_04524 [Bifiguratus adelaidae]